MKISAFKKKKNGRTIDEKDVVMVVSSATKTIAITSCGAYALPILKDSMPLTGIVAQASSLEETGTAIADAFDPLIHTLQDLAEPFSLAFCLKGIFMKMQGHEAEGNKAMKNSIYGYLTVQFLPQLYDLLKAIKF